MNALNFLNNFEIIKKHLILKFPEFEKKSFSGLLDYLKKEKVFEEPFLLYLEQVWQVRNRLAGKSLDKSISEKDLQIISRIKKELKL